MKALEPGRIGGLELPNRFIKTATYEGMSPSGRVGDALVTHHRGMAAQHVGLTTVAYAAVCRDGRTFEDQLLVDDEAVPGLRRVADAVHSEGGFVSLQLGHCGGFSKNKSVTGGRPMGPSARWNEYGLMQGLFRVRAMSADDIADVVEAFGGAARRAKAAGFDAVEVHVGHGYLLSQFLSPAINRRRDAYGGDLSGRLRLTLEVIEAVRAGVGPDFPILAKLNTRDDIRGGLEIDESVETARRLEAAGVDALVPSGGVVFKSPFFLLRGTTPTAAMIAAEKHAGQRLAIRIFSPLMMRSYPYTSTFFFEDASRIRAAVTIPVILLGGVDSAAAVRKAMDAGFEFVAMGRALLADPDFIPRLAQGEDVVSRCTHCNECIGAMDRGGVRCTLDD